MTQFTTRVELHNTPNGADYEKLHSAMEKEGFTRTIISDDGITYHLPTAEYNKEGDYTKEQVLNSAKRAANTTGKTSSILVSQSNARIWYDLDVVKKQD